MPLEEKLEENAKIIGTNSQMLRSNCSEWQTLSMYNVGVLAKALI